MINWFNMPDEGLSNGGLFEVKELEVTENGTYETKGEMYNKVTVNVEGGGGSSDFSTAEVTIIGETTTNFAIPNIINEGGLETIFGQCSPMGEETLIVPLYKGSCVVVLDGHYTYAVSGNITNLEGTVYQITGDCIITIS